MQSKQLAKPGCFHLYHAIIYKVTIVRPCNAIHKIMPADSGVNSRPGTYQTHTVWLERDEKDMCPSANKLDGIAT